MDRVRGAIVNHAMRLMSERPDEPPSHINLYLPCTFFMLRSIRCGGRPTCISSINLPLHEICTASDVW